MAGYDWRRGYGPGRGYGRPRDGYGADFGGRGDPWRSAPWRGPYRPWGGPPEGWAPGGRGYDRGLYGGEHPSYGGYPGGLQRGMYYGGRGGYGADLDRWEAGPRWPGAGYDRGAGYGRDYGTGAGYGREYGGGYGAGYGSGVARFPFVPEEAYRRHPEMGRVQEHVRGGWPDHAHDPVGRTGDSMDDDELVQAVRQNLHQDDWIHPDRIQVKVESGVVTLTGEVDDYMEARYAWDDAWETAGVRGVINHLTVRTDQPHEEHGDPMPQTAGKKKK